MLNGNLDIYFYQNGIEIIRDYHKAIFWYRESANQGNKNGQYHIGMMYEYGYGIDKNLSMATDWYLKSSKQEDNHRESKLNHINAMSIKDKNLDEKYNKDNSNFMNNLDDKGAYFYKEATMYENIKDYQNAVNFYEKAVHYGDSNAQFRLGNLYTSGKGVNKNMSLAANLFQQSAEKGNKESQYILGHMYLKGNHLDQNDKLASLWILKSAEQGYQDAQYQIALMYEDGIGVDLDFEKALDSYKSLADVKYEPAQSKLGDLYSNGIIVKEDDQVASEWYVKSYYNGNKESLDKIYELGVKAESLIGFWGNTDKMMPFYKKAADLGHEPAQLKLALLYEKEFKVVSYIKAIEIYQNLIVNRKNKNAKLKFDKLMDDENILYEIGMYYEEIKNYDDAMIYYDKSAIKGHPKARKSYEKLKDRWSLGFFGWFCIIIFILGLLSKK